MVDGTFGGGGCGRKKEKEMEREWLVNYWSTKEAMASIDSPKHAYKAMQDHDFLASQMH